MASTEHGFHLFPLLPAELRYNIWEFFVKMSGRVVRIAAEPKLGQVTPLLYWKARGPPPAFQHICRETRNMSCYTKAFTGGVRSRYTWINFMVDVVEMFDWCLDNPCMEYSHIRQLRLKVEDLDFFMDVPLDNLEHFKNLQRLWIISKNPRGADSSFLGWGGLAAGGMSWGCPLERVIVIAESTGSQKLLTECLKQYEDWWHLATS
ncbi:hypothetical protein NLU13_1247 [Sarocladium strictum]|uniref:2EXR domain-containing protein n=1 Tax=Sarocladium strictum TaxID=5046 RepID=A0AA39GQK8_SARSR|nr:hypothetical protein NLU13_1247 [Sarocladium strictum]